MGMRMRPLMHSSGGGGGGDRVLILILNPVSLFIDG